MSYIDFINKKTHLNNMHGFKPVFLPDFLYDFQKYMVEWSIEKGRGALFEDCGLGKTPQLLVWAENIVRQTNKRVLILTPLAVSYQTVSEGEKFGIEVEHSRDGKFKKKIIVTNYERLHFFNSNDFVGLVCDESSILKNYDNKRKTAITEFVRKMPYRLLTTATAAPNDYIELGTSSEALGFLGFMDMLNRFFKNEQNNSKVGRHYGKQLKWRFKRHAEKIFWRWVSSWARAIRSPSDFGFDDSNFILPKLKEVQHTIEVSKPPNGELFVREAVGLKEQRKELRDTLEKRCEKAASLVGNRDSFVVWCQLNDEGDLLERLIPNAVQIAGKHTEEQKEERLIAFQNGEIPGLVTKQKIAGFGLNWQHCNYMSCFPSHSYEQYYQAVRRCWRFGQKKDVTIDIITTPGMSGILNNLQYKSKQADKMFNELIINMNNSLEIKTDIQFNKTTEVPAWL